MDLINIHRSSSDWGLKYRPSKLDDLIMPDRYKKMFSKIIEKGELVNLLFSGSAGCGKTSLALILADALDYEMAYFNMSKDTSVEVLRNDIMAFGHSVALNGKRKLIVADECEKASTLLKDGLKAEIEALSENVSFIFITNHVNMMPDALMSRLQHIEFNFTEEESKAMKTAIYKRTLEILDLNKVEYEKAAVPIIVNKLFPDFRRILNRCQCLANQESLTKEMVEKTISVNTSEFFDILKNKKFKDLRQYIANLNINPQHFYSEVFKDIENYFERGQLAQAIIILERYSYQSAFVIDHELNLTACCLELKMIK
jgi:replication factor C small subunit